MFTEHAGSRVSLEERTPLKEPFASFLKSIVRLREEGRRVAAQLHGVTIRAGRYLYDASADVGHDPCRLVPQHFQDAAGLCSREKPSSRYRTGQALVHIAEWIDRYNLAATRLDFQNPFPRVAHDGTGLGKEADEQRAEKMPSEAAMDAIAQIAHLVEEPREVTGAKALQLLACGGWRINELLTVPDDCEKTEPATKDGKPVLDADGQQVLRYGITYFPEKGPEPDIKWIATPMVDVAKEAVAALRRVTAPAREVARWMEANPGRAWLPGPWLEAADEDCLTSAAAMDVLKVSSPASARATCERLGAPGQIDGKGRWFVTKRQLSAALLASQPKLDRTDLPMRPSQYLFLMQENWNRGNTTPIPSILAFVTDGQIYDFVVEQPGKRTLFQRFGFSGPGGSPIEVTSHQFRHWLNTLQQQGGMSQMEIARWSGRKDVGQNAAYNHVSPAYRAEQARKMMEAGKVKGPAAEIYKGLPLARREEFARAHFVTAHTTDLGMCVRDWSYAPCTEHGACAGCAEHLINKGDAAQKERADVMLAQTLELLGKAEAEAQEETYGASNYAGHHRRTAAALRLILDVHADPGIADGDLVQLNLQTGARSAPVEAERPRAG